MKKTLTLIAALAALALTPQSLLADTNPNTNSNGMYERLEGSDKPFAGKVQPGGSGCGACSAGCGSSARKTSAEIQMSVIMPMIFKLNLNEEQKVTIQEQMQTLQPTADNGLQKLDPKQFDTKRIAFMRFAIAQLTPEQRKTLIEQLSQR